jgi:hypothetical protein
MVGAPKTFALIQRNNCLEQDEADPSVYNPCLLRRAASMSESEQPSVNFGQCGSFPD